jgi:hypothetical protein
MYVIHSPLLNPPLFPLIFADDCVHNRQICQAFLPVLRARIPLATVKDAHWTVASSILRLTGIWLSWNTGICELRDSHLKVSRGILVLPRERRAENGR